MLKLTGDIIKFIVESDPQITETSIYLWNIDYRDDILDYMTAREVTSTYID